jgi:hypothetical protein
MFDFDLTIAATAASVAGGWKAHIRSWSKCRLLPLFNQAYMAPVIALSWGGGL